MTTQDMERAIAEVWALFKATDEKIEKMSIANAKEIKASNRKVNKLNKATNEKMTKVSEDIDKLSKATDEKLTKLAEDIKVNTGNIDKVSKQVAEVSKDVAKVSNQVAAVTKNVGDLANKWGRFLEFYLMPGLPKAFQQRGIPIQQVFPRAQSFLMSRKMEVDLIGVNGDSVVVVEVKSTLRIEDVTDHLAELARFKQCFPAYSNKKILGAVAAIEITSESDKFASRHGLFVLGQSDDAVAITNDKDFTPKFW